MASLLQRKQLLTPPGVACDPCLGAPGTTAHNRTSVVRGPPGRDRGDRSRGADRYSRSVADEFDPADMVQRFRTRAEAVRTRGLPPVEGPERQRFKEQAQLDFMDFAMLGDAETSIEDGILIFRIDLRPGGDPDRS